MKLPGVVNRDLLEELGLAHLPEAKQEEILLNASRIIYQGILIRIMELLDENSKAEFESLLGKDGNEEAIVQFLESRIPDLDLLVEDEIEKFKAESLALLEDVK